MEVYGEIQQTEIFGLIGQEIRIDRVRNTKVVLYFVFVVQDCSNIFDLEHQRFWLDFIEQALQTHMTHLLKDLSVVEIQSATFRSFSPCWKSLVWFLTDYCNFQSVKFTLSTIFEDSKNYYCDFNMIFTSYLTE